MMQLAKAASAYRSVQVTTSSPADVVVLLYDAALRFVREARAAMEERNPAVCGERISRAHAVVELLASTVDPKHDRVLAERLVALYLYVMRRLFEANVTQSAGILQEIDRLLAPLRDAWKVAASAAVRPDPRGSPLP